MLFSLTSEQKKDAYNSVRLELQKSLILRLSILGIDPESFDEEDFVPSEDSTAEKNIYDIINKIKEIDDKISKL